MQYLGGKARIAKRLVPYIQAELAKPGVTAYYEPFMGGGNIISQIKTNLPKYASDAHPELMALWQHLQSGGDVPTQVSEEDYRRARDGEGEPWLRGFIGFGGSFGGKWFGGYVRDPKSDRNYFSNARNSLRKKIASLHDVRLSCHGYADGPPFHYHAVIYCDPPYANTTGYSIPFDHDAFWAWVELVAKTNIVLVSEYASPLAQPFVEIETRTDLRTKGGGKQSRIERLFRFGPLEGWPLAAAA